MPLVHGDVELYGVHSGQVAWCEWPGFSTASIAANELLPIIVATAIWDSDWAGLTVLFHCDNQSVVKGGYQVAAVKGGYCRDPSMAHMLRCLFFLEAKFDITLTASHVAGVENGAADAISRNKMDAFFALLPQAQQMACQVPKGLVGRLVGRLVGQQNWTSDIQKGWLETLLIHQ